jgi:hypothetical protein
MASDSPTDLMPGLTLNPGRLGVIGGQGDRARLQELPDGHIPDDFLESRNDRFELIDCLRLKDSRSE